VTGMRPAAKMLRVEIDEDARAEGPEGAAIEVAPTPDAERPTRGWALRHWVWLAGVAVACVVALLATSQSVDAREGAEADRIAGIPGMVRPLVAAPVERWRAPATPGAGGVVVAADQVVTSVLRGQLWWVSAYAVADGTLRWSSAVFPSSGWGGESPEVVCPGGGAEVSDVGALVVCVASFDSGFAAQVIALSSTDGQGLGGWTVDGQLVGFGRVADDLVVGTVLDDGRALLERRDARTGAVVWSHLTTDVMRGDQRAVTVAVGARFATIRGFASEVVALTDGSVVNYSPIGMQSEFTEIPDGFATFNTVVGGHLYDDHGVVVAAVQGLPARLQSDDGSLGDVVVIDWNTQLRPVRRGRRPHRPRAVAGAHRDRRGHRAPVGRRGGAGRGGRPGRRHEPGGARPARRPAGLVGAGGPRRRRARRGRRAAAGAHRDRGRRAGLTTTEAGALRGRVAEATGVSGMVPGCRGADSSFLAATRPSSRILVAESRCAG